MIPANPEIVSAPADVDHVEAAAAVIVIAEDEVVVIDNAAEHVQVDDATPVRFSAPADVTANVPLVVVDTVRFAAATDQVEAEFPVIVSAPADVTVSVPDVKVCNVKFCEVL